MSSINLNDALANEILQDHVCFKLVMAKKYLEIIPNRVTFNYDLPHFHLEKNVESFLFYANLAIELISHEIVRSFNLQFTNPRQVNIYKIKNKLDQKIPKQKQVYDCIAKYFEYPTDLSTPIDHTEVTRIRNEEGVVAHHLKVRERNGQPFRINYDFSKSTLWKLRELRNHVSHKNIIYRMGVVAPPIHFTELLFDFEWEHNGPHEFSETTGTPHQYFDDLFKDLIEFIECIRNVIPPNSPSSQYNNQLNFELK